MAPNDFQKMPVMVMTFGIEFEMKQMSVNQYLEQCWWKEKKIIIKFYNFYDWLILIKRPQKALNKWNSIPNGYIK